jgi:3-(3-hydroxy-phenyl)propionate hydroxylase
MVDVRYDLAFKLYPYARGPAQDLPPARHPVVVVGGGPIGMAMALDLGQRGTPVLVLDDHEGVGQGSRAICFAKRTLEIADRLGFGKTLHDTGVVWNLGRVFHGDAPVFTFNLQPEAGHKFPAFINLQQPYFEKFAVDTLRQAQAEGAPIEIRGRNRVSGLTQHGDYSVLDIDTPDGSYQIEADWVIACDGARSPIRGMMGLEFEGRMFEDNFLIADVKMTADFPTERWFWFDPPFEGAGQSALLHKQPDDIWRIDFQLGWDIDRKAELDPANIRRRVDAMLSSQTGTVPEYELEWTSIYTFQCRRMEKFRHGRVLFAGDAAHQVSPFGARGANSGVQDTDNLAWKLDLVLKGLADDTLIDSYDAERSHGADENILNSTRSTDFMTPKSDISKVFRNAVLRLAQKHAFARPLVNSGRLSVPCVYDNLPLNGPDDLDGPHGTRVGASCPDAPLQDGFLLEALTGDFTILAINTPVPATVTEHGIRLKTLSIETPSHALKDRYLGVQTSGVYLIRPDQHVAARWGHYDADALRSALNTALAKDPS